MGYYTILHHEKEHLRELTYKCREIAENPATKKLEREWRAHNKCEGTRPMIIVEQAFDVGLTLQCENEGARML